MFLEYLYFSTPSPDSFPYLFGTSSQFVFPPPDPYFRFPEPGPQFGFPNARPKFNFCNITLIQLYMLLFS